MVRIKPLHIFLSVWMLTSCSLSKRMSRDITKLQQDTVFARGHVGLSIRDEKSGKYVYEQNASKYFAPASNVKLFTCYAVMKYLPDSLPGWYMHQTRDTLYLKPNGDPTFLHPDFPDQPVMEKLVTGTKPVVLFKLQSQKFTRLGYGWPWGSWQEFYMPEKSVMPIYGNIIRFRPLAGSVKAHPAYFQANIEKAYVNVEKRISVKRAEDTNEFTVASSSYNALARPFTQKQDAYITYKLLTDTLVRDNKTILFRKDSLKQFLWTPLYTQYTDSVLKYMMHRSDNFLAEQLLLMAGNKISGFLNDRQVIAHLIKNDFSTFADKPRWVDGSGLSRLNMFSPNSIIELLVKMKADFPWGRITTVLPHGDEGTLKGYYKGYENNIWAKTGGLTGSNSLSGYLITKKGNNYNFSFVINNHQASALGIRKSMEKILINIINKY